MNADDFVRIPTAKGPCCVNRNHVLALSPDLGNRTALMVTTQAMIPSPQGLTASPATLVLDGIKMDLVIGLLTGTVTYAEAERAVEDAKAAAKRDAADPRKIIVADEKPKAGRVVMGQS